MLIYEFCHNSNKNTIFFPLKCASYEVTNIKKSQVNSGRKLVMEWTGTEANTSDNKHYKTSPINIL